MLMVLKNMGSTEIFETTGENQEILHVLQSRFLNHNPNEEILVYNLHLLGFISNWHRPWTEEETIFKKMKHTPPKPNMDT